MLSSIFALADEEWSELDEFQSIVRVELAFVAVVRVVLFPLLLFWLGLLFCQANKKKFIITKFGRSDKRSVSRLTNRHHNIYNNVAYLLVFNNFLMWHLGNFDRRIDRWIATAGRLFGFQQRNSFELTTSVEVFFFYFFMQFEFLVIFLHNFNRRSAKKCSVEWERGRSQLKICHQPCEMNS